MSSAEARRWEILKSAVLAIALAYLGSLDRRIGMIEQHLMGHRSPASVVAVVGQLIKGG